MSIKSESTEVRISRRVLWIGSEAYPLANIARAQAYPLKKNNGRIVGRFIKRAGAWFAVWIGAGLALSCSGTLDSADGGTILGFVSLVAGAGVLWSVFQLIRALTFPPLYALLIETAGSPRSALISTDRKLVYRLVNEVIAAIDDPYAEFQIQVENFVLGDQINQQGDNNIGTYVPG